MLQWISNLEPEFLILFLGVALIAILALISISMSQRTLNLIGKRVLELSEDLMKRDGIEIVDIVIANTSYVNVEVVAAGLIYQKALLPLKEESVMILARDSHKISIHLDVLRNYVIGKKLRMKKLYVYVEDALGRRIKKKAKNSVSALKKTLKIERKALKIEQKKQRFLTGNYRLLERTIMVFAVIFSPFTKLSKAIKTGLNRRLKNREINIEMMSIEKKHKQEMKDMFEEARRENQKLEIEKKILEQEIEAVATAKLAAENRREESKRVASEIKKNEEERKKIELEMMKDSETFDENQSDEISENEDKKIGNNPDSSSEIQDKQASIKKTISENKAKK